MYFHFAMVNGYGPTPLDHYCSNEAYTFCCYARNHHKNYNVFFFYSLSYLIVAFLDTKYRSKLSPIILSFR